MQTLLGKHWHHVAAEEAAELLGTNMENGLSSAEAGRRVEQFGPNEITPPKGKSPLVRFLLQFNNPLIYILLIASGVTAVLKQELVDALIILGVVVANAIIGYLQETKAEKAIEALQKSMEVETTVLRDGKARRISAKKLVPGDVVLLKSGDKVPADMRLFRTKDLQVAEAALTGESAPVEKFRLAALAPETGLGDRSNMAYTATLVTYGQGAGIVTSIGDHTEIGRISQMISAAHSLETPLTRKIAQFSRVLLYVILALAAAAFGLGLARGQDVVDTFTAAVALAVAAIPEGLPAALTVTLAIGVSRMAKRQAIIRKLPAVETLGSVTVICSDKTGTLTQNEMTVQEIWTGGKRYTVSGTGYVPQGEIKLDSETAAVRGALEENLRAGLLCNDSGLAQEGSEWQTQGDPTEIALLVSAHKGGLAVDRVKADYRRLDEIPFESQHQYMATLHAVQGQDRTVLYVKGATEVLLERSSQAVDADGKPVNLDREAVEQQVAAMAARGLRVLALAKKEMAAETRSVAHSDLNEGLTFIGLQGMIDPPRPEAMEAVCASQKAGVRVKMITGDHALTAAAIAGQLNLTGNGKGQPVDVLTGKELEGLSDEALVEAAQRVSVFARVTPEQKLRLVKALQARGEVVAMTGDGVNDGPALKQADIGIAMGITGTDVAKEASDMILTDDNFATIRAAVEEGRSVFDNLTKIIAWTLPTNIGEGLVILAALLLGVAMPILPGQILWINLVTVVVLGLVLALEQQERDIMARPPRQPDAPILGRALVRRMVLVGVLILAGAFGLFELELMQGHSVAQARTVAVNAVIAIAMFYLLNTRALNDSVFRIGLFSNLWAVGGLVVMTLLQVLFTYAPFMNVLFDSAPITPEAWVRIVLVGLAAFVIVEVEKWLARRKNNTWRFRANVVGAKTPQNEI